MYVSDTSQGLMKRMKCLIFLMLRTNILLVLCSMWSLPGELFCHCQTLVPVLISQVKEETSRIRVGVLNPHFHKP